MKNINRLEKNEAKVDGLTPVHNSGRGLNKGDAKDDEHLYDYKFNATSFSLTLKNWIKFKSQAWNANHREPVIAVKFEDGNKVAIIDWPYFEQLKEKAWILDDLRNS